MSRKVLYIAPTLPVLTSTFVYREIFDLRGLGFEIDTVSMKTPLRSSVSDESKDLLDTTLYLDRISEARKVVAFFKAVVFRPSAMLRCFRLFFGARPMRSFRDYARYGYHFIEACYLAFLPEPIRPDHIHCHFITGSTSIGMFLSELIEVSDGFRIIPKTF